MTKTFGLIILFMGFLALGISDQTVSVAWPFMKTEFNQPVDGLSLIVFITAVLSTISCVAAGYLIRRFSAQKLVVVANILIALYLFGYSFAPSWLLIIVATIPFGIGFGIADVVLNCYALSEKCSAKHLNWLHGTWGIGAALGPAILTFFLDNGLSWKHGYITIGVIQLLFVLFFVATKKYWNNKPISKAEPKEEQRAKKLGLAPVLSLIVFFVYNGLEVSVGTWYYTIMIDHLNFSVKTAGLYIVLFWGFLTFGRFVTGVLAQIIGEIKLITYSLVGLCVGLFLLTHSNQWVVLMALCITGFSFASIYPTLMHQVFQLFDKKTAVVVTGLQTACASLGFAIIPPLVGIALDSYGLQWGTHIFFGINIVLIGFVAALFATTRKGVSNEA